MKKFSLFLPSRGREPLLMECVRTFFHNAKHPERVEMIVVLDDDDVSNPRFEAAVAQTTWNVRILKVPRSNCHQRDYNNVAARLTTGDYLWALNDDVIMPKVGWDVILEDYIETKLRRIKDRALYVGIDDTTHVGDQAQETLGCCFPILTRELYQRLGFFFPEEVQMWGADIWLYQIIKKAGIPVLRVPLQVPHKNYHNGLRARDETSLHVERISEKWILNPSEVDYHVARLVAAFS
jgi:hypothetical protein